MNFTETLLSKIVARMSRKVAFNLAQRRSNENDLLIENKRLMIACRITCDGDGTHRLFLFDQITGNELATQDTCFIDRDKAIAAAYGCLNLPTPQETTEYIHVHQTVRPTPSFSETSSARHFSFRTN